MMLGDYCKILSTMLVKVTRKPNPHLFKFLVMDISLKSKPEVVVSIILNLIVHVYRTLLLYSFILYIFILVTSIVISC